jgi:MtN3 and saliva related transmembrane protein
MNILNFLGWGSFLLFAIMQVPQMIKTIKTKDVSGVSVLTWIIYTVALMMSAVYLYFFNEVKPWPVLINQFFSAFLSFVQVLLFYKYKKNG